MATINFTKAALGRLVPPAKGWVYHRDERTPGLAIGVGATGVTTFVLYKRINGRPERVKLGRYPDMSIEQARRKAAELNGQIAQGKNPADLLREKRAEIALQELFDLYVTRYAIPHGLKTIDALRETFNVYLGKIDARRRPRGRERRKPAGSVDWSNRKLSSITHQAVLRLHHDLGTKTGKTIANRVIELLRAVFNRCAKLKLINLPNPAADIEPYTEIVRGRFLQADEIPRFFAALENESEQNRDYFLLALLTGGRRSNVLAMRWDDIDLHTNRWTVPGQRSKNGQPMVIPLTSAALSILKRRTTFVEGDFVFPSASRSGHITSPKKAWERIVKRADLRDVRPHDLRRSLGSWMVNTGASLAVTGGALGHKDAKSTEVYARLAVDPVKDAMERAQKAMLELAEPSKSH